MTEPSIPGLGPEMDVPEWLRPRMGQICGSCGAPIVMAISRMDGTKTMPVDPKPSDKGNLKLWLDGGTMRVAVDNRPAAGTRWVSHFVTCPDAKKWRKKR